MFLSLLFIQNLSIFAPLIINLFTMKEWRCNWGVVEVSQVGPGRGRREERKEGERERERGRRVQVVSLFPITFLLLSFLLPVLSLFPFQKPESMQSTLVGGSAAGRLQGAKATLYVGGLSDNVNEAALHAAFIPFGEIKVCEEKSTPQKKKKKKKLGGIAVPFSSRLWGSSARTIFAWKPRTLRVHANGRGSSWEIRRARERTRFFSIAAIVAVAFSFSLSTSSSAFLVSLTFFFLSPSSDHQPTNPNAKKKTGRLHPHRQRHGLAPRLRLRRVRRRGRRRGGGPQHGRRRVFRPHAARQPVAVSDRRRK